MTIQTYESWTCTSINLEKDGGTFSKLHFVYIKDPSVQRIDERGVYIETWPFETSYHDSEMPDRLGNMQTCKEQWKVKSLEISSVNPPCVDVVWVMYQRRVAKLRRAKRRIESDDEV